MVHKNKHNQSPKFKDDIRTMFYLGASVLALAGGVKGYNHLTDPGYTTEKIEISGSNTNSIWAAVDKAVEGHSHDAGYIANETDRIADQLGTTNVHPGDVINVRVPKG